MPYPNYYARVRTQVRPKAGATVFLIPHRYPVPLSPEQAREFAADIAAAADEVEAEAAEQQGAVAA